jgi:hypothetical protein
MDEHKFCKVLTLALTAVNAEVWLLDLQGRPLLDAVGKEVPLPVENADVFFLDYQPEANWAHSCGYCFMTNYGMLYHAAEWPPHESIPMRKL